MCVDVSSPALLFVAALKDTVLVTVFCVLLHPLQVLLVALEAPGVVLELWAGSIAPLQAVVEHLGLLEPLQLLLTFHTGGERTEMGQSDYSQPAGSVYYFGKTQVFRDQNKTLCCAVCATDINDTPSRVTY